MPAEPPIPQEAVPVPNLTLDWHSWRPWLKHRWDLAEIDERDYIIACLIMFMAGLAFLFFVLAFWVS